VIGIIKTNVNLYKMNPASILRLAFGSSLILASFWSSATVTLEQYKNTSEFTIRVHDEIVEQDLNDFKAALDTIQKDKKLLHMNAIQLNSNGGNGSIGRKIGTIIRDKKLYTYVAPKAVCISACVYVLMGGVVRYPFGEIGVHRTTYPADAEVDDSLTETFVRIDISLVKEYSAAMGLTYALREAILNTESWRVRIINEVEKQEWQVYGADRAYEERLFTAIGRELNMPRSKYINIFTANYQGCQKEARRFERSIYDCTKTKTENADLSGVVLRYFDEAKSLMRGLLF